MNLAVVILAAGESRRMGSPKPLLRLGGLTFLEHVIAGARAADPASIVIVTSAALLDPLRALPLGVVEILPNHHPERGMSESLRLGLQALGAGVDAVLIVLADHPHVRPESVAALAEAARLHPGAIILPAYNNQRGHPVIIPAALFPEIHKLDKDRGLNSVIEAHAALIRAMALDDPGVLMDIDTPGDFIKFQNQPVH